MASDRIGQKSAELVGVPPFEIRQVTTDFMLEQPQVAENIMQVPLNEKLMKSIRLHGITNPLLCMKQWYPLAGSQRIRAVAEIKKQYPTFCATCTRPCHHPQAPTHYISITFIFIIY